MTDLRQRLADVLREQRLYGDRWPERAADKLLSLPGIAVVDENTLERIDDAIEHTLFDHYTVPDSECSCGVVNNMDGDILHAHHLGELSKSIRAALLAAANKAESSSSAHGSAGDDRPPHSVCDPGVERGGLPTSMADTLERLDIMQDELERVQRENEELRVYAARDTARLNSELSQAVAQRDIARQQRDDARAQLFGMTP